MKITAVWPSNPSWMAGAIYLLRFCSMRKIKHFAKSLYWYILDHLGKVRFSKHTICDNLRGFLYMFYLLIFLWAFLEGKAIAILLTTVSAVPRTTFHEIDSLNFLLNKLISHPLISSLYNPVVTMSLNLRLFGLTGFLNLNTINKSVFV
jgi:hypothetical protein